MKQDNISLAHGSGGKLSYELIKELILPAFGNPVLNSLDDAASLPAKGYRLAYSTDSYVVKPLFFPGGDIGKLAICGTVNDLAMLGAVPSCISVAMIIEEGLSMDVLKRVVASMKQASRKANVKIVTGDIKVVGKGGLDQLFINTSGIGYIPRGMNISGKKGRVGDLVLLNGTIGDHGMAVLAQREGFQFSGKGRSASEDPESIRGASGGQTGLKSDCAPLNKLVADMLKASKNIHVLRDPTRGGLAATLNEIAIQSKVEIIVDESCIPVREEVKGACEMLGLDVFSVANEGKLLALVSRKDASRILMAMKKNPLGREAAIIGEVKKSEDRQGRVILRTFIGGQRILDMPSGELLPRIC